MLWTNTIGRDKRSVVWSTVSIDDPYNRHKSIFQLTALNNNFTSKIIKLVVVFAHLQKNLSEWWGDFSGRYNKLYYITLLLWKGSNSKEASLYRNVCPPPPPEVGTKYTDYILLSGSVCVSADVSRKKGCWSGSVTVYEGHSGMVWSILITPRLTL